jgi:hypothetical protein
MMPHYSDIHSTIEKRAMTSEGEINLSTLHPTDEKISAILYDRVAGELVDYGVENYIFKYGLKKLIKGLPKIPIYQRHHIYTSKITERLNALLLQVSLNVGHGHIESMGGQGDIILSNRFKHQLRRDYANYVIWNNLSASQRKIACSYIAFSEIGGDFIDTRMLDVGGESNVLREGTYNLPFYGDGRLSIEDAAMVIIDDIIEHDPHIKHSSEAVLGRIQVAISSKRAQRRISGPQFLSKILDGITLTKIIKRVRKGVPWAEHIGKTALEIKVKANKIDVPDVLMDVLIHSLLSAKALKFARELTGEKQRLYVKMALLLSPKINKSNDYDAGKEKNLQAYVLPILKKHVKDRVQLPFLFMELDEVSSNVTVTSLCSLTSKESIRLIQPSLRHLNGVSAISHKDNKMLTEAVTWNEEEKHFSMTYDEACEDLMTNLTGSPLSPSLPTQILLEGRRAGVTTARTRVLIKHMFITFPTINAASTVSAPRMHHDITTSHAPKVLALFESWRTYLDPNAKTINRLVELLSTQIAGAQGDLTNAFSQVSTIYRSIGRESQLSKEKIKSLSLLDVLLRSDPATEKKVSDWVAKNTPKKGVVLDRRRFMAASTKDMQISRVLNYLKKITPPVTAHVPAIHEPIARHYGGISIEILPINYLDGHLGVSVPGVCIEFDSPSHIEHNSTACANLLIRDETGILLWGLLVRDQMSEEPLYFLNNLQGSLPSRWAKNKERIKQEILEILGKLGEVRMNQFSFNALSLIDEDTPQTAFGEHVYLPPMRLDGFMHPYEHKPDDMPTQHYQINGRSLYKLMPHKKSVVEVEVDVIEDEVVTVAPSVTGVRGLLQSWLG